MFNNKYSKFLTVILIVVIIAIVALLGFLGYDAFTKYTIDSESEDAVSKFEEELNKIIDSNIVEEPDVNTNTDTNTNVEVNVNTIEPEVNLNTVIENTTTGENSSSGNNVQYKGYDVIGTIEIPKTDIKYPIIKQEDVGIKSLKVAICNLYGKLNEPGGNAVLVGHNYRNGTFFSNNKKLQIGDKIYITDNSGKKVTYEIYKKYETGTGDFSYATRNVEDGVREISLSTCNDDSSKRLIIWAREK